MYLFHSQWKRLIPLKTKLEVVWTCASLKGSPPQTQKDKPGPNPSRRHSEGAQHDFRGVALGVCRGGLAKLLTISVCPLVLQKLVLSVPFFVAG